MPEGCLDHMSKTELVAEVGRLRRLLKKIEKLTGKAIQSDGKA
jgi:hypothetical protein